VRLRVADHDVHPGRPQLASGLEHGVRLPHARGGAEEHLEPAAGPPRLFLARPLDQGVRIGAALAHGRSLDGPRLAARGLLTPRRRGSSPLPEAVTRSTGIGAALPGSAARRASTRPWTALARSGFVGPRFEPEDDAALSGKGDVADGRLQKYFGSSKGWPMRREPTAL